MLASRTSKLVFGGVATAAVAYGIAQSLSADEPDKHIFVINGFYMAMREKYTKPEEKIHYYVVEWDSDKTSWEQFRGDLLGATDPATAEKGSLRRAIFDNWQELGLKSEPNVGDNGMHASASPFEALAERNNWLKAKIATDVYGKEMLKAGISEKTITEWSVDPQVAIGGGKKGSLFDALEDMDAAPCTKRAQELAGAKGPVDTKTNAAFVFIKPHAVTAKVEKLVAETFASKGFKVVTEGNLDGKTIEEGKLIDQHYYAIANKASLTKPKDLNPPEAKRADFQKKFGVSWEDALAKGMVFNAVDGCKEMGIDGDQMDKVWAGSKKAGNLVKFGGGFYAGKVPMPKTEPKGWFASLFGGK